jgi:hypothetical protein
VSANNEPYSAQPVTVEVIKVSSVLVISGGRLARTVRARAESGSARTAASIRS